MFFENKEMEDTTYPNLWDTFKVVSRGKCRAINAQMRSKEIAKIDHIIGSKSLLSKCKRMEIITNILSDHSAIKLELRIKKNT